MSEAFKPLLARLADGQTMGEADADAFFAAVFRGEPSPAQVGAAVTAMRMRGETVGELVASARAMRDASLKLEQPYDVVDVCGTGGDGLHTLNISTAVGFVVAGAGVKVAKHGGRAASSKSGSSDVLSALGVNIAPSTEVERRCLDEAGICFMFAPNHHPAMKYVIPIRSDLGFRTVFNLLGPLTNPAGARRQVVGVPSSRFVEPIARALGQLGATRAWVVHGEGMDELTTTGESEVAEWRDGTLRLFTVTPEAVGLPRASLEDLRGGGPEENALALRALLGGQTGAYRDIVLLNSAAALLVADKVETLSEGVETAARSIDSGAAASALDKLVEITRQ
ncbi:MAG: anthranilate phosphoribosyltransferase [Caulobacteraceae bacterium]|nr:anthranilate phosphoribosyltransferase [Caulobacteraceae bacterium]